jgi:hypothetical protein
MTTPGDHARVRELLGREPRGRYEVVVRDRHGDPVVLRNAPLLDDDTPMPTRYWLVGPDEVRRIGRLEAAGGVGAAESAVDPDELAAAHLRYAAERDAAIPPGHRGPRPSGGVGGTRIGVKCLHAHWAWHLAGGDDPVGVWIAERLAETTDADPVTSAHVRVGDAETTIEVDADTTATIPWGVASITNRWLSDHDPPRPEELTNALGLVTDHLDDVLREHPRLATLGHLAFSGPCISSLARLEVGHDRVDATVALSRESAEDIFRMIATEPARDRHHQPGLPSAHVDLIVATCCIVLALMRRLHIAAVALMVEP